MGQNSNVDRPQVGIISMDKALVDRHKMGKVLFGGALVDRPLRGRVLLGGTVGLGTEMCKIQIGRVQEGKVLGDRAPWGGALGALVFGALGGGAPG
ncbi:hypothetical protein CBL_21194 [Carabus blaptoides fortunei]